MLKEVLFGIYETIMKAPEIEISWIIIAVIMFIVSYVIFCLFFLDDGCSTAFWLFCGNMIAFSIVLFRGRYVCGLLYIASYIFLAWFTIKIKEWIEKKIEEKKYKNH